jgi:hypothetical protein
MKKSTLFLAVIAIAAYACSLFLPVFSCAHTRSFIGYEVLAMGWVGIIGLDPRWWGNVGFVILMFGSFAQNSKFRPALAVATVLLALSSFIPAAGCAGGGGAPEISKTLAFGGVLWVIALLMSSFTYVQTRSAAE